jgi:hypothetical protein
VAVRAQRVLTLLHAQTHEPLLQPR